MDEEDEKNSCPAKSGIMYQSTPRLQRLPVAACYGTSLSRGGILKERSVKAVSLRRAVIIETSWVIGTIQIVAM